MKKSFSNPLEIIKQISFNEDAHIADFGCGAGNYSLALARNYSSREIFAIDVRKDMLKRLQNIAESEDLHNLHSIWGDVDNINGSRLRDSSVDFVLLINTLFQLEDKKTAISEAFRVLKPFGKIILIDWSESFGNIGPKIDHVINESTAKLLLEESGFSLEKEINAGAHHYGFIARKI